MVRRFALALLPFLSLIPVPTMAQDQASVRRGAAVSERRCVACHAVRVGETASPFAGAPAFSRVAASPGVTELALQAMLQTSHKTMPNVILDADDMRDVIAYILSLRRR